MGRGMGGGMGRGMGRGQGFGRGMCRQGVGPMGRQPQPSQPGETPQDTEAKEQEESGETSVAPFGFGPRRYRLRDGSCLRGKAPRRFGMTS